MWRVKAAAKNHLTNDVMGSKGIEVLERVYGGRLNPIDVELEYNGGGPLCPIDVEEWFEENIVAEDDYGEFGPVFTMGGEPIDRAEIFTMDEEQETQEKPPTPVDYMVMSQPETPLSWWHQLHQ